jgi:hypothetical protein
VGAAVGAAVGETEVGEELGDLVVAERSAVAVRDEDIGAVVGVKVVGEDVGAAVGETEVGDEELGDLLVAVGEDVVGTAVAAVRG